MDLGKGEIFFLVGAGGWGGLEEEEMMHANFFSPNANA